MKKIQGGEGSPNKGESPSLRLEVKNTELIQELRDTLCQNDGQVSCTFAQTHSVSPKVSCGLWVVTANQCRDTSCNKSTALVRGVLAREAMPAWPQGHMAILCSFPSIFLRTLTCSLKNPF